MRRDWLHRSGAEAVPAALRMRWWIAFMLAILALIIGATVVSVEFELPAMLVWMSGATGIFAFILLLLWYHLPRNYSPDRESTPASTLGLATVVTLIRGGLVALLAGFLLVPPSGRLLWAPAILYGSAASLDWIDGRIARSRERVTILGERMDMALDTTGLLIGSLVGILWGRIPIWYLAMPAARYCYRAGLGWRERRGLPVKPLPDSAVRRPLAGLQMAFVAIALVPIIPVNVVWVFAGLVLIPGLGVFLRDYLSVTGRF